MLSYRIGMFMFTQNMLQSRNFFKLFPENKISFIFRLFISIQTTKKASVRNLMRFGETNSYDFATAITIP